MIEVEQKGIVGGDGEVTVRTMLTVQFCCEKTCATRDKVPRFVTGLTIPRVLGLVEGGRVRCAAGAAGRSHYSRREKKKV
jgi:hypothetical protein